MRALDRSLFHWINSWPNSLTPVMSFFSEAIKTPGLRIALGLLLLGMILRGPKSRKAALLALVACLLANETTDSLKAAFAFARPSVDFEGALIRASHLTSQGTASAHSANMAAAAFIFTYYLGWWGAPWIVVALLTGVSRIYMGVHYPSQVLVGWLCGLFCAFLVVKTWEAFAAKRNRQPDRNEEHAATVEA